MTERLIGIRSLGVGRSRRVRSVLGSGSVRAQGLVGVGSLFSGHTTGSALIAVVVGRATGAAAGADHPEEAGSEGKGDGQPGGDIHVLSHGAHDTRGL